MLTDTTLDLLAAFEEGTLSPAAFPRRDHVRVARPLVRRHPLLERWYHPETLESPLARRTCLWPDRPE